MTRAVSALFSTPLAFCKRGSRQRVRTQGEVGHNIKELVVLFSKESR